MKHCAKYYLPKRLVTEDLRQFGYTIKCNDEDPNRLLAKHDKYDSYRHQCDDCKIWFDTLQSYSLCRKNLPRICLMLCLRCIKRHFKAIERGEEWAG